MRHTALIFMALVCASCSESKEDLRDKICDLQNQVSELQEQLSEKDERIEEKLSNIQSYASDAESTMDNIHSYGNRFGDIDDAEDAVTSITDEADY